QYAPATIAAEPEPGRRVCLQVETEYPWHGVIAIAVTHTDNEPWQLALRVPAWCARPALRLNGKPLQAQAGANGYLAIARPWREGDRVELDLPMTPALLVSHPRVEATRGCVAIARGPVVYCLEACDQEAGVDV